MGVVAFDHPFGVDTLENDDDGGRDARPAVNLLNQYFVEQIDIAKVDVRQSGLFRERFDEHRFSDPFGTVEQQPFRKRDMEMFEPLFVLQNFDDRLELFFDTNLARYVTKTDMGCTNRKSVGIGCAVFGTRRFDLSDRIDQQRDLPLPFSNLP